MKAPLMDYEIARTRMVKEQCIARGITDESVLRAMGTMPRHLFVDAGFEPRAYGDHPLPIGNDQTISQPYIVALMTTELGVRTGMKILEVGTGSGYQAAILGFLGCTVYTVERHEPLSKQARRIISRLGIKNIHYKVGDGSLGWDEHAPYDGIIVTAGAPVVPEALQDQLAVGGTLVIPVGGRDQQRLLKITRGESMIEKQDLCACTFVPLVGAQANREV
jgi:protein-L-isoaspartate(D-aspartate) O-methyltransferase